MNDDSETSGAEAWMALPLFNRKASPDHEQSVLTWFECWRPPEDDVSDFKSFEDYEDSPTHSLGSSGLHSGSLDSDYNYYTASDLVFSDDGGAGRNSDLLSEISDDHIPQLSFSTPSTCPFPGCKSTALFTTGRDFRRHYRQHFKRFFCRFEECSQSTNDPGDAGKKGFATRKDRARHEAKHNPGIRCQWRDNNGEQCTRTFSRMDNMRDHFRRIHGKE
uniref:Transcription factor n=1 Tax=Trichoderma hypoxylon TaxID=1888172 RepID=A0A2H4V8J3_9HYPO|nr:transcription factor [Trichoderma hypoxylon]